MSRKERERLTIMVGVKEQELTLVHKGVLGIDNCVISRRHEFEFRLNGFSA